MSQQDLTNEAATSPRKGIPESLRRFDFFVRTWATFAIVLFAATIWLWVPHTVLPQIPFFEFLVFWPVKIDYIFLASVFLALAVCSLGPARFRGRSCLIFSVATIGLILFDQNRLQPWAYQFVILGVLFSALPTQSSRWLRYFVVSIYFFSAISKFDYQFVHTVGETMWRQLLPEEFGSHNGWRNQPALILLFPAFELLVAILLLIPRTRRLGVVGAILTHVSLLAILGPWGMNHRPPVLIWNLFFIVQACYLFWFADEAKSVVPSKLNSSRPVQESAGICLAVFVTLFPLTQPLGICDHWPAWEVYAPRTSRAKAVWNQTGEGKFASYKETSLNQLGVPLYPQARYQFALARSLNLTEHYDAIVIQSESDRWTGERMEKWLSREQIEMWATKYWLNVEPRIR